jgi:hypothetical protein
MEVRTQVAGIPVKGDGLVKYQHWIWFLLSLKAFAKFFDYTE